MANYNGVFIFGEMVDGKISTVTKELLNMGRRLRDNLKQPLSTLLIGKNIQEEAKEVITLGADRVYVVDAQSSAELNPDLCVTIITEACHQTKPSIVILGQTDMGRQVAPRLAARLGTTVTMDCTDLAIDPETKFLLQTKPVYGGNAVAVWSSRSHEPQIVTLRQRSVMQAEPDTFRKGEVINLDVTIDDSVIKSRVIETVREDVRGIKLDEAKVIVAGGGGIGSRDGFKLLEELAHLLGGAIGITRVPCDEGWMPSSMEIGQTAHILNPSLYIAIGISGAPQHMAGVSGSKCIVAINRDPDAHIFKEADFGVVGDYREVLPPLIEKCRDLIK